MQNACDVGGRYLWSGYKRHIGSGSRAGEEPLVESAKRCGVNPYEYLRDVLARLPQTRLSQVPQLLPDTWLKTAGPQSVSQAISPA